MLNKPVADRRIRSGVEICFGDSNSYESLSLRWRKKPELKKMWDGKSSVEKAQWYRYQQENGFGSKRTFSEMTGNEFHGQ